MKYILIFLSCLICGFGFVEANQYDKLDLYHSHLHPRTFHHPERHKNCLIQLKDGSIWNILPKDRAIISSWKKSHELVIMPVYSNFWPNFVIVYNYALHNLTEDTKVSVCLDKVEYVSLFIEAINKTSNTILLNDNSIWKVGNQRDISSWRVGQRILIGVNHKWHNLQYPQILINADLNTQHVSAVHLNN